MIKYSDQKSKLREERFVLACKLQSVMGRGEDRNSVRSLKQAAWRSGACRLAHWFMFGELSYTASTACLGNGATHSGMTLLCSVQQRESPMDVPV